MSDAKNQGSDDLPELPDDSILEEVLEPLEELPDDIEELPDDVMELPDDVEEVPAEPEPVKATPKPVAPVKKAAPKPVAPKPAAKKETPKPAPAKSVASKPESSGDGEKKPKQSAEEREAAKKARAAERKQELDRAAGRTGQKRELDQAPLVLRKASVVMGAAAIIPFATGPMELWPTIFLGKALILLGGWIFYQSHVHNHGGQVPGFIASLSKGGAKTVYAVFGVLALVGLWNFGDVVSVGNEYGFDGTAKTLTTLGIIAEKLILLLCLFTYTHIYDYEHGGKFNPIFPLMYLGGAIGGLGAIVKDIAPPPGTSLDPNYIAALGAVGVCVGGCMAMWTMWLAMKEAKEQGEKKKAAQVEARKAAREARRDK